MFSTAKETEILNGAQRMLVRKASGTRLHHHTCGSAPECQRWPARDNNDRAPRGFKYSVRAPNGFTCGRPRKESCPRLQTHRLADQIAKFGDNDIGDALAR